MPSLKAVGYRIAAAFVMESEKELREFIRGYVVGRLARSTAADFAKAIKDDTQLWQELPDGYKRFLHNVAKSRVARASFRKYSALINADLVLKWFGGYEETGKDGKKRWVPGDRPDLASVVLNWPDGTARRWLQTNMDVIKRQFIQAIEQQPQQAAQQSPPAPSTPSTVPGAVIG